MSCLSDIDLATLHQSRLNERVRYKLSEWNRPRVVQLRRNCEQHQYQPPSQSAQQQPKTNVQADQRRALGNRKTATKLVNDSKIDAVESTTTDGQNGFSVIDRQRKCINVQKSVRHQNQMCVPNTASERCDMIVSNANELTRKVVVNDEANTIADDRFPLRRRRSGTWP